MTTYTRAGISCTKCIDGQALWVWEPVSTRNLIPPFAVMQVLKCFQCSNRLQYSKISLRTQNVI